MLYVYSSIRTFVRLAFALAFFYESTSLASLKTELSNSYSIKRQTIAAPAAEAKPPIISQIKSYREWKTAMIGDAAARVKVLKDSFIKSRSSASMTTEAGLSPNLQNIQNMIDKEELQYSLAQDLTITDYFVGYLTKQKSLSSAIKEVSGRLTADEVAELMTAYAENFFSSKPAAVPQPPKADSGL